MTFCGDALSFNGHVDTISNHDLGQRKWANVIVMTGNIRCVQILEWVYTKEGIVDELNPPAMKCGLVMSKSVFAAAIHNYEDVAISWYATEEINKRNIAGNQIEFDICTDPLVVLKCGFKAGWGKEAGSPPTRNISIAIYGLKKGSRFQTSAEVQFGAINMNRLMENVPKIMAALSAGGRQEAKKVEKPKTQRKPKEKATAITVAMNAATLEDGYESSGSMQND